jgi:hypothetical protein
MPAAERKVLGVAGAASRVSLSEDQLTDRAPDVGRKCRCVEAGPQGPTPLADIHGAVRQGPGKDRLACGLVGR